MSDDTSTVEKPAEGAQSAPAGMPSALPEAEITRLTDEIVTALKTVYDPEIPADIYEIGLIYRIDIADDRTVKVDMSLTSPNCPSAQELPVPRPSCRWRCGKEAFPDIAAAECRHDRRARSHARPTRWRGNRSGPSTRRTRTFARFRPGLHIPARACSHPWPSGHTPPPRC